MTVRILHGDCRETMATLEARSINCAVTSPPYWGLRDYGTAPLSWPAIAYSPMPGLPACVEIPAMDCSLGLEPTLEAFIGHMVLVFRGVHRVLRDDGTAWVNMGDSYAGARSTAGEYDSDTLNGQQSTHAATARQKITASRRRDDEPIPRSDVKISGLKAKDLVGQPWRLAFALQADGWWLRSDTIWHKPNPMPESTKDRPTKAHEYFFLLAKSERYYFDHDAIKEPASPDTNARYARGRSDDHKHAQASLVPGQQPQTIAQGFEHMRKPVAGWASGPGDHSVLTHAAASDDTEGRKLLRTAAPKADLLGADGAYADGKSERLGRGAGWREGKVYPGNGVGFGHGYDNAPKPRVKNNENFDAAMADMPDMRAKRSVWTIPTHSFSEAHFATFPPALIETPILASCPVGGTVLDPFGGAGTTGLVSDRLGRNAILCELNPAYAGIAERRLAGDAGHVARQIPMEAV